MSWIGRGPRLAILTLTVAGKGDTVRNSDTAMKGKSIRRLADREETGGASLREAAEKGALEQRGGNVPPGTSR